MFDGSCHNLGHSKPSLVLPHAYPSMDQNLVLCVDEDFWEILSGVFDDLLDSMRHSCEPGVSSKSSEVKHIAPLARPVHPYQLSACLLDNRYSVPSGYFMVSLKAELLLEILFSDVIKEKTGVLAEDIH